MPFIHSVHTALPKHYFDQEKLIQVFRQIWGKHFHNFSRIEDFHRHVQVKGRYLALEYEEYEELSFSKRNEAFLRVAQLLLQEAATFLLKSASLRPEDISLISSVSTTGIAAPSLEARLMNEIPFAKNTKRLPIVGLGCLGGVAGLNRVADYLKGAPTEAALFLSVELCSLTIQLADLSVPNLIASGLFGDGAAAVLLVGDEHPLAESAPLQILDTQSSFFPNTERVMGWDVVDSGFKIVLSPQIPELVRKQYPGPLKQFLEAHHLDTKDMNFFIAHPGGPKVLMAMEEVLGLSVGDLRLSWDTLKDYGNMSSVSVLFVLKKTLEDLPPLDSLGLMTALGPAFSAETTLLKRVGKV